ncbi:putative lyase [bacterium BMS3Bbin10]|nr:putative lyase [bacterium BMS3Bbin10]
MNIHHKDPTDREKAPVSQPVLDEVCQVLNGILSDGVDVHRCLAARASGRIGAPAAVQPLIAALLDEDEDVRTDAAEALSELADPQAGQQLFENLLGDPCTEVKLAAIETLAKLQDKRVIPWLQRMVKGRDEEIIWDEEEFYSSGWDDWVDIQIKAVDALAELDAGEAVPDIVAAMQLEDGQDMTEAAFKALARMGQPGIEALACFLDEDSVRLRRRAAAALAASGTAEAAGPLARAFADQSAEVRRAAMEALVARDPADGRLAALLEDPDATVRAEAVRLIGGQHPDRLAAMIDDTSNSVQLAVLRALRDTQDLPADEALVAALREKLEEGTGAVAAASARALAALVPQEAADDLIPLLGDTARPIDARRGALQGLAAAGGERAVEALAGMIGDEERPIRLETMPALARLARADTVWPNAAGEALLFALRGGYEPEAGDDTEAGTAAPKDPGEEEGEPASASVAENEEDAGAFPTSTMSAILDDAPEMREVVGLPEEGVELTPMDMERLALAKRIRGKKRMPLSPDVVLHEDIRHFAARVLGDLHHADVAHELAGALENGDAELRLAAADSLARIGEHLSPLPDTVTEILMATAAEADRDLKLLLIRALAAAGGEAAPAFLVEQIGDEDSFVRTETVRALFRLGRVGSEIEALLDDPDPSVRLSAAEAIAGVGGDGTVELLVDFALSFEGYHGRLAARLLRDLDATRASAQFVDILQNPDRKRIWSVAIEALEELNCSHPVRTAEVPDREGQG